MGSEMCIRDSLHDLRSCPELCIGLRVSAHGTFERHLVGFTGACDMARVTAAAAPCSVALRGPRIGRPPQGERAASRGEDACMSALVTPWVAWSKDGVPSAALHGIDHADFTILSHKKTHKHNRHRRVDSRGQHQSRGQPTTQNDAFNTQS